MNLFLIIIQPTGPKERYIELEKSLQEKGDTCHQFGYTWMMRTSSDSQDVYRFLERILKPRDQFLITTLSTKSLLCRSDNDCYHF